MRRIDPRLFIGILLVLGGVLALLDVQGIISNAGGIFWGLVFAAGGIGLIFLMFNDRSNWWAAFPAFTLLGLAASAFLPESLQAYGGLVFFIGISAAFWWVYFTDRARWWAIIPAGVLLTLGVVSAVDNIMAGRETGGFFFLGLGITFLLVALLPSTGQRSWALIPGILLVLFGIVLGVPFFGFASYFWPAVLIVLGGFLVFRFFRDRPLN